MLFEKGKIFIAPKLGAVIQSVFGLPTKPLETDIKNAYTMYVIDLS